MSESIATGTPAAVHETTLSERELILGDVMPIGGLAFLYSGLTDRYELSHYGLHHATQPLRWTQHHDLGRDLMLDTFGADVHPHGHLKVTDEEIAVPFLYMQNCTSRGDGFQQFKPREIAVVRFGSRVHDIGENEHPSIARMLGRTLGDRVYGTKTHDDISLEAGIRRLLYTELYTDIPTDFIDDVEDMVAETGKNPFTERAFEAIERIGFLRNGFRAAFAIEQESRRRSNDESKFTDEHLAKLRLMALRMLTHQFSLIVGLSDRYAYPRFLTETTAPMVERTLARLEYEPSESLDYPQQLAA